MMAEQEHHRESSLGGRGGIWVWTEETEVLRIDTAHPDQGEQSGGPRSPEGQGIAGGAGLRGVPADLGGGRSGSWWGQEADHVYRGVREVRSGDKCVDSFLERGRDREAREGAARGGSGALGGLPSSFDGESLKCQ